MRLALVTLVVPDYDEAIRWYGDTLGFQLIEDAPDRSRAKRWVVMRPPGGGAGFVLGLASNARQRRRIGDQTGGRVAFFLQVDDFAAEHARLERSGVRFVRPPAHHDYGTVAVFEDPYGNLWDLVEFTNRAGSRLT